MGGAAQPSHGRPQGQVFLTGGMLSTLPLSSAPCLQHPSPWPSGASECPTHAHTPVTCLPAPSRSRQGLSLPSLAAWAPWGPSCHAVSIGPQPAMQSWEWQGLVPFFSLQHLGSQEGQATDLSPLGASGEAGSCPKGLRFFLFCTQPQNPYPPPPSQTKHSHFFLRDLMAFRIVIVDMPDIISPFYRGTSRLRES